MNLALLTTTGLLLTCSPQDVPTTKNGAPVEYGHVRWARKLEPVLERSKQSSKPVVLCFQEVPG